MNPETNNESHGDSLITETGATFRDRIATIDKSGKRKWIFPKKPKGKIHNARVAVAIFLLAILIILPFIKVDGHPIMLFDVMNRHFIIFGKSFWPQDFFVFAIAFLSTVVFVVIFTLAYGRLWCGWACPQTIFMEMLFRKIEYLIEGDAASQRKLKQAPISFSKILKKSIKHAVFFGLSFFIGNLFLSYIIGVDALWVIITDPISRHIGGFVAMLIFSAVFYFVFAWFREQACTIVCPYGRLQGVLLDKNSIVVAYDYKRGEPRGKIQKTDLETNNGDCIDCTMCVQVCPTGIDIRNGTQLECINCAACIDACNEVMTKVSRPKKLIKYGSFNQVSAGLPLKLNIKHKFLTVAAAALIIIISALIITRQDYIVNIIRSPGTTYQADADNKITNIYKIKFVNKTFNPTEINLKVQDNFENQIEPAIKLIGHSNLKVASDDLIDASFFVTLPKDKINKARTKIKIGVYRNSKLLESIETVFMGPGKL